MGTYDEIYCHAALPDGDDPPGSCFQTKSFPDPCLFRYRITSEGRLIDSAGNDLEPEGYITFYTTNQEQGDSETVDRIPDLREYRARFSSGQLRNIVRVEEDDADRAHYHYGLASFRWFAKHSFLFGDSDEDPDASKCDVQLGNEERR
jgi:hypothetical protein